MEQVEEAYCLKLIQDHEPDPGYRNKNLMSFEGFVRFLMGKLLSEKCATESMILRPSKLCVCS